MGLACVLKKLGFWQPHLKGKLILVPQHFVKFYLLYLPTLKIL